MSAIDLAVMAAYFAVVIVSDIWSAASGSAPVWLSDTRVVTGTAVLTTLVLALVLARRPAGARPGLTRSIMAGFRIAR